jgi:amidase
LKLFFKAVLDAKPWRADPLALHIPFNDSLYALSEHNNGRALCFGFISDNGIAKPDSPYARALAMTKSALEAQGHTGASLLASSPSPFCSDDVFSSQSSTSSRRQRLRERNSSFPSTLPMAASTLRLNVRSLESRFLVCVPFLLSFLSPIDVFSRRMQGVVKVRRSPFSLSPVSSLTLYFAQGLAPPHLNTYEFWQLSYARRRYITEQLAAWEATSALTGTGRPVDALISPPAPYCSFRHGEKQDIYYTGICNLNDWPATIFPVTTVDEKVDVPNAPYEYHSEFDKLNHERCSSFSSPSINDER